MSAYKSAMRFGLLALLAAAGGCYSQAIQPLQASTPLPPVAASPFGFRPFYPNPAQPFIAPQFPNRYNPYVGGPFVPILQQSFDISPEGSYTFGYQSADGSQRQETGTLKYPAVPGYPPVLSVQGAYAAITPEGVPIEVSYLADENGYQPSGPGVHPAIQRAVAQQVALAKQEQLQQPQIRN